MTAPKYPAAGPVVGPLLEILDILEASQGPWVPTCICGWRGPEFDNEADSQAAAWAHAPCFGPYYGQCSCGWTGDKHVDRSGAERDWQEHLASHDREP